MTRTLTLIRFCGGVFAERLTFDLVWYVIKMGGNNPEKFVGGQTCPTDMSCGLATFAANFKS